jgi:hypothetical protein
VFFSLRNGVVAPSGQEFALGAVVGAVDHDGVLGDAQFVKDVEQLPHVLFVVDHGVVIGGLPAAGLAQAFGLGVGPEMHVGGVHPHEKRCARGVLTADEVDARCRCLVVDGLHALAVERTGVFDALLAHRTVAGIDLVGVGVGGPGVDDAARQQGRAQQRGLLFGRVVGVFGLFLGVEVIQVAEELVEAVRGEPAIDAYLEPAERLLKQRRNAHRPRQGRPGARRARRRHSPEHDCAQAERRLHDRPAHP